MEGPQLEETIKNVLILGQHPEAVVNALTPNLVRNACKLFWRANNWSFAMKTAALTLTADATSYSYPEDCDKIIGIRRTTTDDYGWRLVGMSERAFDENFPYPDSLPNDAVVYYKVVSDDGTKTIVCFPVSDANDNATILYKVLFKQNEFYRLTPDDYEPTVLEAALYLTAPAQMRGYAMQAWRVALIEAMKLDHEHGDFPISRDHIAPRAWPIDSWQFYLSGGNPYAQWLSNS